jgi:hypothetical protein
MDNEITEELARLEAEHAALEERRRAREASSATKDRLAELQREVQTAKLLEQFEAEGERGVDFDLVETVAGPIVVKRPHPATFKKFRDGGKYSSAAIEDFVRPCVAHPSKAELGPILERFPGVVDELADVAFALARGRSKRVAGK